MLWSDLSFVVVLLAGEMVDALASVDAHIALDIAGAGSGLGNEGRRGVN